MAAPSTKAALTYDPKRALSGLVSGAIANRRSGGARRKSRRTFRGRKTAA